MNDRLEKFIRDHREEFDDDEPGKKVWEDIQFQIEPGKKSEQQPAPFNWSKIFRLNSVRWSAAAAIIVVMVGSIWYFQHSDKQQPGIAAAHNPASSQNLSTDTSSGSGKPATVAQTPADSLSKTGAADKGSLAVAAPKDKKDDKDQNTATTDADATINEEMYHYARLVELKHKELKTIEKDEPLLYKQFAADVHNLDSVYQTLQQQLPKNPNREQLLEAMLQNLQLQMGLLNHQLDIIKQINHSKKTAYEKAYKTV